MHGLLAELACKPKRGEVKIAVDKAVETKLGLTVFAGLMVHHFLAYLVKTGLFGQIRYVAVHVAVDLYMFDNLVAVCLQAAVEVMEIMYAAHFTSRSVEELCRQSFRQRVVAFFLISRHKVVAILSYHAVKLGDLVGAVLQVGVHCDHNLAPGHIEADVESRRFAIVAAERSAAHMSRVRSRKLLHDFPRRVCRAVVDKNHLIAEIMLLHHTCYPRIQLRERFFFII